MEGYTLLKVIGEGSFGKALLVQSINNKQQYVMKEIRLPKSSGMRMCKEEAILLAKMKHPNIVAFKGSFEAEGHLYIVMEYCDGGDLMEKIKLQKGTLFSEDVILNWFVQICLGVRHIHDQRVLHRDIKSKNIFLTKNGILKLGDFGSARLLNSSTAFACTYVGTPYYVSPEIWENRPYNNKSDVWALGCVLYELCTLKHPFQASSWKNLILKICRGSYTPIPSHFCYELHYVIKQMFKRNTKDRPSVNTLLTRRCFAKLINKYSSSELGENAAKRKKKRTSVEETLKKDDLASQAEETRSEVSNEHTSKGPSRRHWQDTPSNTVLNVLENASLLSVTAPHEEEKTGGHVTVYPENSPRRQWNKEPSETLLDILKNADVSLAFETYTVRKPVSENLIGPLSDTVRGTDNTDGIEEVVTLDLGRNEPRSDEDDTDFEEEAADSDWISALKIMAKAS
ncbi:serine/threonine-protein kinase Nek3 [Latimeria chalumnae]|uniref:serine/threonine-protein kinase Nek3 n=1 Tax=Latimeria chalumnae TaxID=7897 RepID=UPI0003C12B86|nr:PREDICTED: serine/threonine-protein kinase Nek3 [Latimeria chalumnae]XP_006002814.1 PREDICTED: serine/threonine-protein kinase Nek3 [Latimeria chalumnae]|eukprot:XP_006002813.1 PREDICTED: serine/threonine-protein kinase Nek3 [Latimeria chalumnae]